LKKNKKMTQKEKEANMSAKEKQAELEAQQRAKEERKKMLDEERKVREEQGVVVDSLDRDGDGDVDLDDLLENEVEGGAQEAEALADLRSGKRIPFFIGSEVVVTVALWTIMSIVAAARDGGNWLTIKAGLDTFAPGMTDLAISDENCADYRLQAWRWISYQFTHVGVSHIGLNTVLNLFLGLPLEAMHGSARMLIMYNVGVLGGALCYFVGDAHRTVVGCSGGCYALIGIHVADLIMNWSQKKFRLPTIILLATLIGSDMLFYNLGQDEGNTSHVAHVGGAIAGLCIGVLVCENKVVKKFEKYLMYFTFAFGMLLTCFCLMWMFAQQEGPKNIFEETGWCWIRAVYSQSINPQAYECISCGNQACIDEYNIGLVRFVSMDYCKERGFFYEQR